MIEDKFREVKRKRVKRRKSERKTTLFNVEELAKICLPKTEKAWIKKTAEGKKKYWKVYQEGNKHIFMWQLF